MAEGTGPLGCAACVGLDICPFMLDCFKIHNKKVLHLPVLTKLRPLAGLCQVSILKKYVIDIAIPS